jgi:hypothetical protein
LLQDFLSYSLTISQLPLTKEAHFKKRQLERWVVQNNKQILDFYNETDKRKHKTIGNRVHGMQEGLDNAFGTLVQLNLIRSAGIALQEKTGAPVTTYKYTKGGILVALIIKKMNSSKRLEEVYRDIDDLISIAFQVNDDSRASDILYSNLFKKCNDIGILNMFVDRIEFVINTEKGIVNVAHLLQLAVDLAFISKQSESRFKQALYETIAELDLGTRQLILYEMKIFAENKFNIEQVDLTRQYERFRFERRNDYEHIALQGFCEKCKCTQNVQLHYSDLIRYGVTNGPKMNCPSCNTKESLFIKF